MTYTFDEFLRHCSDFQVIGNYEHIEARGEQVEIGGEQCFELNVLRVWDYMKQIYPDEREASEKGKLFVLMQSYIAEHIHSFGQTDLANHRNDKYGSLVRQHLLQSVHQIFTTRTLAELGHGPDPMEVIQLAASFDDED